MLLPQGAATRITNVNQPKWMMWLIVPALLAVYVGLAVGSYVGTSATWDEPQHLAAGCFALHDRDYRITPDHPPLLRMWAALPAVMFAHLQTDPSVINHMNAEDWLGAGQFYYAHRFMYVENSANALLSGGRFMIVLLGVALGILLFRWALEWLGFWPAVAVLTLYCLEPNLQAHSTQVTTDFGFTCFLFGTLYFLWKTCRRQSPLNILGLCIFFSLSAVSKFSAVLMLPIVFVLVTMNVWPTHKLKPLVGIGLIASLVVVAWLVIWAAYGFAYMPCREKSWKLQFDQDAEARTNAGAVAKVVGLVDRYQLVPNAFSQGFLRGQAKVQTRSSFLAGQYSNTGWWYYFPAAFLFKTPVGLILLFLAGLAVCAWRWRSFLDTGAFIVLPIVIYLAVALTQRLNIGLRHILPIYPFVLMLAGWAIAELLNRRQRAARIVLAATGLLSVAEFARAYPHNLAFFNSFVGGPRNGYKYLVDSNLDWGQDAPALRQWLDANNLNSTNAPVYVSYFGTADLSYHGINVKRLPGNPDIGVPVQLFPLTGGAYCISATMLQGVYNLFPGLWTTQYEQIYQQTLSNIRLLEQTQNNPAMRQQLISLHGEKFWNQQYTLLIALRFARLCAYLRERTPDDQLGYSILIYRLTDQQVQDALFGAPPVTLLQTRAGFVGSSV
jgi:hypothetical protein